MSTGYELEEVLWLSSTLARLFSTGMSTTTPSRRTSLGSQRLPQRPKFRDAMSFKIWEAAVPQDRKKLARSGGILSLCEPGIQRRRRAGRL
jgi:hypothetical protein